MAESVCSGKVDGFGGGFRHMGGVFRRIERKKPTAALGQTHELGTAAGDSEAVLKQLLRYLGLSVRIWTWLTGDFSVRRTWVTGSI